MNDSKNQLQYLGYITIHNVAEGTKRAGILITTFETFPLEFRVTNPIKPTPLQKALYGNTLEEYIAREVGQKLTSAVSQKPLYYLTNNKVFLDALSKQGFPIMYIEQQPDDTKLLDISIEMPPNPQKELAQFHESIKTLSVRLNILDPFRRLAVALEEAHKMNVGETPRNA